MHRRCGAGKGGLRAAFFILLATLALQAGIAFAHGDDRPKHGGIMGRGDDSFSVEFVLRKGVVTVYIEDHEKEAPVAAGKMKGAWLSITGSGRLPQQAELKPAGANSLSAAGLSVRVGDRMSVRLVLPDGRETDSLVVFREAAPRR
jgi:hypothetical protein